MFATGFYDLPPLCKSVSLRSPLRKAKIHTVRTVVLRQLIPLGYEPVSPLIPKESIFPYRGVLWCV
jgi:hypothetical protein